MDAPCVGREGSSHLWEELLPAQKPHKGPGGQGLEYLMPWGLICSEHRGLLWAINGHRREKSLSSQSEGGGSEQW